MLEKRAMSINFKIILINKIIKNKIIEIKYIILIKFNK